MAGSQTFRVYVDDQGIKYSVQIAKHLADSLAQSIERGTNNYQKISRLFDPRDADYPPLPRGFVMRYAVCHRFTPGAGSVGRSVLIYYGDPGMGKILDAFIPSIVITSPTNGEVIQWVPSRLVGESKPLVSRPDEYQ